MSSSFIFNSCILGGTFSIFHIGHKVLILAALRLAKNVKIGITSDDFAKKLKKAHPIERYSLRKEKVSAFCMFYKSPYQTVEIFPLNDKFGPALDDEKLECIIVSEETFPVAKIINEKRIARGFKPLAIFVIDLIKLEYNKENRISSTYLWLLGA